MKIYTWEEIEKEQRQDQKQDGGRYKGRESEYKNRKSERRERQTETNHQRHKKRKTDIRRERQA